MKKHFLFIAAMLAVCICSALACSSVHKTETAPTAQPTEQPTERQAGHQVPPDSIEFRSVEEMQAFFASVKLDESKVESYIEERGIRRCCGVRNKAELSDLFSRVGTSAMIKHRWLSDTLTLTVYENGTAVLVNYAKTQADVDGVTVSPESFAVTERGSVEAFIAEGGSDL